MSITISLDEIRELERTGEKPVDSKHVADKFERLRDQVVSKFTGTAWFETFRWVGSPTSPYVGPPEPDASKYVWLGMAHETYRSLDRLSGGLQIEFGIDADSANGFYDRDVLCGLYFGPWATDPEVSDIADRFRSHSTEISEFLRVHPEFILVTTDAEWSEPKPEQIEELASALSSGFSITRNLTFTDLNECHNVTELVAESVRAILPLYGTLAAVDGLENDALNSASSRGHTNRTRNSAVPNSESGIEDRFDVAPTVPSVASFSSFLEEEDVQDMVDTLTEHGATRDEALQYISKYAVEMDRKEGFYAVPGIGPKTGYVLAQNGVTSLRDLMSASLAELGEIEGLNKGHLKNILKNISDSDEFPTEENTVSTKTAKSPADEDETSTQSDGRKIASETADTDASSETIDGLPVKTYDGEDIVANPLSEYYEAFRSVRKVLSTVMQLRGTDFEPDDLTDPAVQYLTVLDVCGGQGHPQYNFPGYGTQHQKRLPFSTTNYRKVFGDSDWVTEYHAIEVEPYQKETRETLTENTMLELPGRYFRPVPPGKDQALPEIVETVDDLRYALSLLNKFPAYPPLPDETGESDRTIPVAELYKDLFGMSEETSLLDPDTLSGPGQRSGDPISGPVARATPASDEEAMSFLLDYGKLTHLFQRVEPPDSSPIQRSVPVFGLDWYQPDSESFTAMQKLAKYGEDKPVSAFRSRLQDMIHRRFLRDRWKYDYITVFPGHEAGSLSPQLVELARDAAVETSIIYTPLIERTETKGRQREKTREERRKLVQNPEETLRVRAMLDDETVILFDDICTTGSSLLAGAHLLRQAGASGVIGLTLGLTPGTSGTGVREIENAEAIASDIIAGVE